ncbi:MAG: DUF3667 domain-containing protein, partial [Gemmatimonadota bacterium]|nr:DUF3667 domain-containing protein [Gemmatimonadota bacterium]
DYSVRGLIGDAFHELTSIDGRLTRSIVALMSKPGLLTRDWFEGRRGRYVKPFSLFLLLNVAFFLVQPHTDLLSYKYSNYVYGNSASARHHVALVEKQRAKLGDTAEQFVIRFNAGLQDQKKSLLVFCIPVVALGMTLMYAWRRRYFAEHLVFSIHAYAFLLLFMGVVMPALNFLVTSVATLLGLPADRLHWFHTDAGFTVVLAVVLGSYLYLALRRVYGDGPLAAVLRTTALFYLIGRLINVYHDVLFYTTLYTL